jgi:hypothetical protein
MKTWAVSDKWYEMTIAVIAATRSEAKSLAFNVFNDFGDCEWIDLRCRQVKSPIPVERPARVLDVPESLDYGFKWNDETMDDFFPGWYEWTKEYRRNQPYE